MRLPSFAFKWQPDEIPVGAKVHVYKPEGKVPEEYEGDPIVLCKLMAGVPIREKLFDIRKIPYPQFELTDFAEGVCFSPVEIFDPWDAPIGMYAIFVDGKRVEYKVGGTTVFPYALRDKDDIHAFVSLDFESNVFSEKRRYETEIYLSPNAQLIPVGINNDDGKRILQTVPR